LVCSASVLTYKLLQLQARLDASLRGWSPAGEATSPPSLSQLHGFVVVLLLAVVVVIVVVVSCFLVVIIAAVFLFYSWMLCVERDVELYSLTHLAVCMNHNSK